MCIPASESERMPSTEQLEESLVDMSLSTPSTVAAKHPCLRPNASVITSAQVIPSAYSLTVPSGKVTLIIDITLASDC